MKEFPEIETRSYNPHSIDPEFVAMAQHEEFDICLDDLGMDL